MRDGDRLIIGWVQPAGWAWDDGVRPGDIVVAVADRVTTSDMAPSTVAVAAAITTRTPGGATKVASVTGVDKAFWHYRGCYLGLALCFALIGVLAYVLAAEAQVAGTLLACTGAWAVALIAAVAAPSGQTWALALVYGAVLALGFATLLTFLLFPVDRLRRASGRWAARLAGGATLALLAAYARAVASNPATYEAVQPAAFALVAAELLGASFLIGSAWSAAPIRSHVRHALGLLALGTATGVLPFGLLALAPRLVGAEDLVPPEIAILSAIFLPLGLAAAVLSRQFLGISRLMRRGLVALVVWLGLVGVYSLVLWALWFAGVAPGDRMIPTPGTVVVGIALVLGTFPPLERWLRVLLESALFRDVYDYAPTLHALSAEIARLPDGEAVAEYILTRLEETLDLSWAALAIVGTGSAPEIYRRGDCPANVETLLARDTLARSGAERPALRVPLTVECTEMGTLAVGPKRRDVVLAPEDAELLATLAPVLAATLQHRRLVQRLENQVAALAARERELAALGGRLMRAQEDERRRVALDLHDDPLQRAVLLMRDLADAPDDSASGRAICGLEEIIASLQAICTNLRPPALDNFGLVGGLERLISDLRARDDGVAIILDCAGTVAGGARLPRDLETALYRVAQEALHNCLKHAEASRIVVTLLWDGHRVTLCVIDDGCGYRSGAAGDTGGGSLHLGLIGMRERLRPWDGMVSVESGANGGTMVTAEAGPWESDHG